MGDIDQLNLFLKEKIEEYKQDLVVQLKDAISDDRISPEEQGYLQKFLLRVQNDTTHQYEDIYELCAWLMHVFQKLN